MLRGKKIILRPLQQSDLQLLFDLENNKENWRFGSEEKKYDKEELLQYISDSRIDIRIAKQYRFVIDLNSDPIGFIDLFNYNVDSAGVGVIILKDYRRQGLAREALELLCFYATSDLDLKELYCNIKKDNFISIKLFTNCGFTLIREKDNLKYFVRLAEN